SRGCHQVIDCSLRLIQLEQRFGEIETRITVLGIELQDAGELGRCGRVVPKLASGSCLFEEPLDHRWIVLCGRGGGISLRGGDSRAGGTRSEGHPAEVTLGESLDEGVDHRVYGWCHFIRTWKGISESIAQFLQAL